MSAGIVVGYDGSDYAKEAVRVAVEVGKAYDEKIVIAFGYELNPVAGELHDYHAALKELATKRLTEATTLVADTHVDIDAVIVGWRPGKEPDTVGALILGLYDGAELRVVGHCSGLSVAEKKRLVGFFAPYESGERGSADPSRWSAGKDLEWVALRPELVVEIDFDHVAAGRIRHGSKLRRWRDDKPPSQCTFDQLYK